MTPVTNDNATNNTNKAEEGIKMTKVTMEGFWVARVTELEMGSQFKDNVETFEEWIAAVEYARETDDELTNMVQGIEIQYTDIEDLRRQRANALLSTREAYGVYKDAIDTYKEGDEKADAKLNKAIARAIFHNSRSEKLKGRILTLTPKPKTEEKEKRKRQSRNR